ncbi:MAG: FISUMP domain-containing protein, partial [Bacteroidota bacterium]
MLEKRMACLLVLVASFSFSLEAQVVGSFVDVRDNQTYETVTYQVAEVSEVITDHDEYGSYLSGNPVTYEVSFDTDMPQSMTWMTQNLNFESEESKCKYESDLNCETYGRLYTWEVAKNVCPDGWHLPSDDEWYLLAFLYGGVST